MEEAPTTPAGATANSRNGKPAASEAAAPPARRGWRLPSEATLLNALFRGLILATLAFLAFDYRTIYEEASAPLPGETHREEPLFMDPPNERDHVRPYLPRSMPLPRGGKGPTMPGYAKPPPHEMMAKPMQFRRGPKGAASAVGRIEPGTSLAFIDFVESQDGEITELFLHSPGGSVQDALAMAKLVRERKIATAVPENGYCASSCPILFSGGVERDVKGRAFIGVHRIFTTTNQPGSVADGMSQGQAITADVQQHLVDMGVDVRAWLHAMKTPSDQLYIFTPDELKEYKFATRFSGSR